MHYEIILYVSDQQRSRDFYSAILDKKPSLDIAGMTEFTLTKDLKLGLMPEENIVKILTDKVPHPKTGNGIPRCELYLPVSDPEAALSKALDAGAKIISAAEDRDWGDRVGYVSDPDGHVLAFAKKIKGTGAIAETVQEMHHAAVEKAKEYLTGENANTLTWEQLGAEEHAKMHNYFTDDNELGFLHYKQDDNNWTALTTHQLFGKNDGEFCCFRIFEIQSFEPADAGNEHTKAIITINTPFEKFGFEYETGQPGTILVEGLASFHAYWSVHKPVEE